MSDNTKFGTPKGMRDWLPHETLLRQKLIRVIESHYQLYGFRPIDTPALENKEVLQGKGGGENEKLMFEVMKRGEDFLSSLGKAVKDKPNVFKDLALHQLGLDSAIKNDPEEMGRIRSGVQEVKREMSDMGLRYDMTVPLARYYANHANELGKPFRCYHIGPVWRADRPQKGRFREFYQCDIDIIGSESDEYEVELLLATDRVLNDLGVGKFKIRISDKRLLPAVLEKIGVEIGKIPAIAVAVDKLDKQPLEEVLKEIARLGLGETTLAKVQHFINRSLSGDPDLGSLKDSALLDLGKKVLSLQHRVHEINPTAQVVFDPLLVRGFDYYTGPVFEINVEDKEYAFSIGGGGRYDGLIEKLGGPKGTPAVGLSLGFERILTILMGRDPMAGKGLHPTVFIANNGQTEKEILQLAEKIRNTGIQVETCLEKKDFVKQMKMAQDNGVELAVTKFFPGGAKVWVRRLSTRQDEEMTLEGLEKAVRNMDKEPRA